MRLITLLAVIALLCACKPREPRAQSQEQSRKIAFHPAFDTHKQNAFRFPVWFGAIPGRPGAYLVLERGDGVADATAWALLPRAAGHARHVFLTLPVEVTASPSDERGLLGLAFHPRFTENRKYYVYYMPKQKSGGSQDSTVIDERRADSTLLRDSGEPPRRILSVAQPYANHNGGTLAFGPKDGFLYIGFGDGGAGGDPHGHGQNLGTLLGKFVRIDVDAGATRDRAYGIPRDNPFVDGRAPKGGNARPEIWAYGLRNPWKWSFDPVTGDLWAGDVGQSRREEIDRVGRGDNLGWDRMEGFACYEPRLDCDNGGLKAPEVDLDREEAESITGGHVYRGDPASAFHGAYLFGDFETRNFFALPAGHRSGQPPLKLGRLPDRPSSFGLDEKGAFYLVGYGKGIIYRVELPGR